MDKKTFLIVLALAMSFLLVNSYFDNQKIKETEQWRQQEKAKTEKQIGDLTEEINRETVPLSELPVIEIYSDAASSQFLSYGVLTDNSVLTITHRDNLPKTVWIKSLDSVEKGEPYTLTFTPHERDYPAIYQKEKLHAFPVGSIPLIGKFTVQLITLPSDKNTKPVVTLGHFINGNISFPSEQLDKLKKISNGTKPPLSIALLLHDEEYLPLGIWEPELNSVIYFEQIEGLESMTRRPAFKTATSPLKEQFYVLENDTQQLVFSTRGGALIEINLPFHSDTDKESVVKEIQFDREMKKNYPYNAIFPERPYFTYGESPQGPYVEHAEGKLGGYYPLLRRDLIEGEKGETLNVLPQYYALNIISDYPETAELLYTVKHFDKNQIVFESSLRHRRITKTFTLSDGAPYTVDLTIQIEGDSRGLWLTTGVPEVEWISNGIAPALKYRMTRNGKSSVESIELPTDALTNTSVVPDWIANSNGFLGMILDPLTTISPGFRAQYVAGGTLPSRLTEIDAQYNRFPAKNLPGYILMLPLNTAGGTMKFRFFAGPFATNLLKKVDATYSDSATGYSPDYIESQTSHGWFTFISAPFSKFLWILMSFFHYLTGSWGLSIILLTVALRVMMYPLNAWSAKSMIKMKQIQPQLTAIQERYKNDPKRMQQEIITLYRDNKVNPISGCFPMLIQMPFLIGMFDLLKSTFELRGASFIPGWINDLAAPDVLFSWNYPIWFIGTEFHLLPIISGVIMFLQQRLMSSAPTDANKMTDQQRQQQAMGTFMSLFLIVIFYNFPSGLNIYFLSSNLLGILQQWYTNRSMNGAQPVVIIDKKPSGKGTSSKKT